MYSWKRFWCPAGDSVSLSDEGFLYDPEGSYGKQINPNVVPFSRIQDSGCLVLLGEPGIGKTTALNQAVVAVREQAQTTGDAVLALNLGEFGDETRLVQDVFSLHEIAEWQSGSHILHLFLDSLDECGLQIPHVAKILRGQIAKLKPHLGRLRLRIACRTADWPGSLTSSLTDFWGQPPAVFELVPLRRRDVAIAATAEGIEAEAFIDAVIRSGAQPLAIKPVTLNFLLSTYKARGGFPSTQSELYAEGCQRLCAEMNPDRQDAAQSGALSAEQRMAVAKRIAAVTMFCGKSSVFRGANASDAPSDAVVLADLVGGTETMAGNQLEVGMDQVKEVLTTGLFSARGSHGLGFAHQTYAEFLAAGYLVDLGIPLATRLKLLRNADDSTGRIVPQLGETAAWLAGMDVATFQEIMRCDPQILVRSDVAKADDTVRKDLVEKLLQLSEADALTGRPFDDASHYHKLNHPTLSNQLEPVIRDSSKSLAVRRFAISLAQQCGAQELQHLLADIAVDPLDNYRVRVSAAYAVAAIADAATQLRLRPLALATTAGDDDFTIRAVALRTLWPSQISAAELFAALEIPEADTYGTYRLFLRHELPQHLTPERLPHALAWGATLSEADMREPAVGDLLNEIALAAWTHFNDPDVRAAMAAFATRRLQFHQDIVPMDDRRFAENEENRRLLAASIVQRTDEIEGYLTGLIYFQPRLLRSTDVLWILDQAIAEGDSNIVDRWVDLAAHLFDSTIPGQLDAVLAACTRCDAVDQCFNPLFSAIPIDSDHAAQLRQYHNEHAARMREMEERKNPPPLDPPPEARIEEALIACEAGDPDGWYCASCELQLEANSTHYHRDLEEDLTILPGWQKADSNTRSRLIAGAVHYLSQRSAGDDWLATNSTPYVALAGYKALLLLQKEAPALFASLRAEVWAQWAPIVVNFHGAISVDDDQTPHDEIARHCAAKAPQAVSASIKRICTRPLGENEPFMLPNFVHRAWNAEVQRTLLDVAADTSVNPQVTSTFLEILLEHGDNSAKDLARQFVSRPIPSSGDGRARAILAAKALLNHADDAGWDAVWPTFGSDPAFGRAVVEAIAKRDMHHAAVVSHLSENDAAALYVWLVEEYPHADDPKQDGVTLVGPREAIAHYRDGVLSALQHRGSKEAVDALQGIASKLPQLDWMKWVIAEARQVMLRATWRPLRPRELIKLTQAPSSQLVQSAAHLQDLILESLASLEWLLQGETPAAPDLWDEGASKKFTPKDENHLSDYIKRHLERDLTARGVVALREVEIRRGGGPDKGQRTDIHVTGVIPGLVEGSFDQVRVIIEVKGSWHQEVDTAMKSQLVDRYLRDNQCRHGVYVVGWYHCSQWDRASSTYKRSRNESLEAAQQRFADQAKGLSGESLSIKAVVLNVALR